jgi:hypothetical protein
MIRYGVPSAPRQPIQVVTPPSQVAPATDTVSKQVVDAIVTISECCELPKAKTITALGRTWELTESNTYENGGSAIQFCIQEDSIVCSLVRVTEVGILTLRSTGHTWRKARNNLDRAWTETIDWAYYGW